MSHIFSNTIAFTATLSLQLVPFSVGL